MEQIGTIKPQSDALTRVGLDTHTADMHHTPDSDEPFIGAPSGEGETPAWSLGALCALIPARIRVPYVDCIEYDGKREFNICYKHGRLFVEKHDESKRYNCYYASYRRHHEEYSTDNVIMPNSYTTDKQEEIERYKGTFHAFGFFGVIYDLVFRLLKEGYIETERNKNYRMWLSYVSFKNGKEGTRAWVYRKFTDESKEELAAKWEERLDDDVEWYHIEECEDFNFGRPKTWLLP